MFERLKMILSNAKKRAKPFGKASSAKSSSLKDQIFSIYGMIMNATRTAGTNPWEFIPRIEPILRQLADQGSPGTKDVLLTIRDGHHGMLELAQLCNELLLQLENSGAADRRSSVDRHTFIKAVGDPVLLQQLLDEGADINAKYRDETALIWASRRGNTQSVRLLLKNGADVNLKNSYGETACSEAFKEGHEDILKLLLESGADPNTIVPPERLGNRLLHKASEDGKIEIVRFLLSKGVSPNIKCAGGATALMIACCAGEPEVVKLLLEKGADVNARMDDGRTALNWAIGGGEIIRNEIRSELLRKGATVKAS